MIYCLNNENVPTIPTPHDCIIKKVNVEQAFVTFTFEDDISTRDSIKCIQPNAKSLIVKIHLIDDFDTYKMKDYKRPWCKSTYARIDNQLLEEIAEKGRLEYLYHYVGYHAIIIKLFCETYIVLDLPVDYIEYEWIEKQIPICRGNE